MDSLFLLDAATVIAKTDYVSFTFFVGTMAMMAASVFFFFELSNTSQEWRTSVLVSGLITFIAAVHYYYMRSYYAETHDSPTFFRYVDWLLTVPLMCVEFYLITKKAGGTTGLLWKMILASVVMLVTGYVGEAGLGSATVFGTISALAYFYIGWAIYPLGYLIGTAEGQWYAGFANIGLNMDIIYNIGDAVNKIGFGLVIYALSRKAA